MNFEEELNDNLTNKSTINGYWLNNPLKVTQIENTFKQILDNEKLLEHVKKHIDNSEFKLDYYINKDIEITKLCSFIDHNYIGHSGDTFIYTQDVIKYYINNSLVISFYKKEKMIGLIVGKKTKLIINGNNYNSIEVNFLSLIPEYRNKNIAPLLISILTKEVILNYNIGIAHYTINSNIRSPYYGLKYFYHRFINIEKLFECEFIGKDSFDMKEKFNTFSYNENLKKQKIMYYNSENKSQNISESIIKLIYDNLCLFNNFKYKIFENKLYEDIKKTFLSKSFHHFIFHENYNIKNYVCICKMKMANIITRNRYDNGYINNIFYEDDLNDLTEYLGEYIFKNNIFDVITWSDFFKINNDKINKGTGFLKYYLFNMKSNEINNYENGLITL